MGIFHGLDISASALMAQRARLDVISSNLANANTTRTESGGPYKRRDIVFEDNSSGTFGETFADALADLNGVRVVEIKEDNSEPKKVYDPGHPDANTEGYVSYPNINPVAEMVNMLSATRSYEANVTAVETYKNIFLRSLDIGR